MNKTTIDEIFDDLYNNSPEPVNENTEFEYICPCCGETIIIKCQDYEDIYKFDDEIFHNDCVEYLCGKYGIEYIKAKDDEKCFIDWFYNESETSNLPIEAVNVLLDYFVKHNDVKNTLIEYLETEIEEFIKWVVENEEL